MKYNSAVVTISGGSFLSNVIANKQSPTLDKMIILNQDLPNDKSLESMTMQDFSNGLSFDINNVSQNGNSFTATSVVTNKGIEQDYQAKLIGITGYTDQNNKQLIVVSQATEPFTIEKESDTPLKLIPSITIGFSNSSQVNITMKDDVYIAKKDLKGTLITLGFATIDDIDSKADELQKKIDVKADKDDFESAVSNINNNISSNADLINDLLSVSVYKPQELSPSAQPNYIGSSGVYNVNGKIRNWGFFPYLGDDNINGKLFIIYHDDSTVNHILMDSITGKIAINSYTPTAYWTGWKIIATNADINNLQNQINTLSSFADRLPLSKAHNTITSNDDLDDLIRETSTYILWGAIPKHYPLGSTGWGYIKMEFPTNGYFGMQCVYDTTYNIFAWRQYCNTWLDWHIIADKNDINDLSNKIHALGNQLTSDISAKANSSDLTSAVNNINNNISKKADQTEVDKLNDNVVKTNDDMAFINRGWVGGKDINTLIKPGVYQFDPSTNNLPESGWGTITVTRWDNSNMSDINVHQRIEYNRINHIYFRSMLSQPFTEIWGGVRQALPISQPQDFPDGKWYADGDPNQWGLPDGSWYSLVNVEYMHSLKSGSYIKAIDVSTAFGKYNRLITSSNDTGWKQII